MTARTKMNCMTASEYLCRNHRVVRRMARASSAQYAANFAANTSQKVRVVPSEWCASVSAASVTSERRSESIDAPTEIVTTRLRCRP